MEFMLSKTEDVEESSSYRDERESRVRQSCRTFDQDYLPIRCGKWAKVNCEFRHRYCQMIDEHHQESSNLDIGCRFIDQDETQPKVASEEENLAEVIKVISKFLVSANMSKETALLQKVVNDSGENGIIQEQSSEFTTVDSGIQSTATSPHDLSHNFIDLGITKEQSEILKSKFGVTKIYVERFRCEDCGSTFDSMDDASVHLAAHFSSTEDQQPDGSLNEGGVLVEALEVLQENDHHDGKLEESESVEDKGNTVDEQGDPPSDILEVNGENASLLFSDTSEYNGVPSLVETKSEEKKNLPADIYGNATKSKSKAKGKKRKKNKPWRLFKKAVMLTVIILF